MSLDSIQVYTDGGSRDDGRAAAAAIVKLAGVKHRAACLLEDKTPVEAELIALKLGLELASELLSLEDKTFETQNFSSDSCPKIVWFSDAETIVKVVNRFRCDGTIAPQLTKIPIETLLERFQVEGIFHPGRKEIVRCHGTCDWLIEKGEKLLKEGAGAWRVIGWRVEADANPSLGQRVKSS